MKSIIFMLLLNSLCFSQNKHKSIDINIASLEAISCSINSFASDINFVNQNNEFKLKSKIIFYLDTPYKFGGTTTKGIDCSAFVQNVFYFALNMSLPRTSMQQSTVGEFIIKDSLKFGDLIFFNTRGKRVSHVGIYLEDNKFVHSSRSGGVKISDINENYYSKKFMFGRRVLENEQKLIF